MNDDLLLLAHGGGGRLSRDLLEEIMLPSFADPALALLDDGAVLPFDGGELVFTTDGYVVKPRFFPGGDIGKLAVCGTVNDLAVCGARALYLSVAFIIEEGFAKTELRRIVASMADAAREAGVRIVTGDTKVVERGAVDGVYLVTSGVGSRLPGVKVSGALARAGQKIIVSGSLGDHAIALLAERHGLSLPDEVRSDCAPLNGLIEELLHEIPQISVLRDITRGGLAAVLNEIAAQSRCGMEILQDEVPLRPAVAAAAELFGFDPLSLANEGKFLICVESSYSQTVLNILHKHAYGSGASIIGEVVAENPGQVVLKTTVGGRRLLEMPLGDLLPRIC